MCCIYCFNVLKGRIEDLMYDVTLNVMLKWKM